MQIVCEIDVKLSNTAPGALDRFKNELKYLDINRSLIVRNDECLAIMLKMKDAFKSNSDGLFVGFIESGEFKKVTESAYYEEQGSFSSCTDPTKVYFAVDGLLVALLADTSIITNCKSVTIALGRINE